MCWRPWKRPNRRCAKTLGTRRPTDDHGAGAVRPDARGAVAESLCPAAPQGALQPGAGGPPGESAGRGHRSGRAHRPAQRFSLVAHQVGQVRRMVVAAPAYLSAQGEPAHPKDLLQANCIDFSGAGHSWWAFQNNGRMFTLPVAATWSSTTSPRRWRLPGRPGLRHVPVLSVAPHVAQGRLTTVLADYELPPRPVSVIYPHAKLLPAARGRSLNGSRRTGQRGLLHQRRRCLNDAHPTTPRAMQVNHFRRSPMLALRRRALSGRHFKRHPVRLVQGRKLHAAALSNAKAESRCEMLLLCGILNIELNRRKLQNTFD